jgi:outer membrane lipoprotein-sorting protein
MKPADNIAKLVKQLRFKAGAETRDRIFGNVLQALEKSKEHKSAEIQPDVWRKIMKSRITRLAAAAAVIIVAILLALDYPGLQIRLTTPAFGDMIEQISKARSVTYKQTIYSEEGRGSTTIHMVTEDGRKRWEKPGCGIAIYNRNRSKQLRLSPKSKTGMIVYKVGRHRGKGLVNHLDWLSNVHKESGQLTGQEEIDGKTRNVFVVEEDFRKTTIWVDPETDLPMRVERVWLPPDPSKDITVPVMSLDEKDFGGKHDIRTISITGDGVQRKHTIVWNDFVWNPDLDDALFSLDPPEDYSIEEFLHDISDTDEDGLINALAFWTEMSGGLFPFNINELGDPNKVKPMLIEKFDRDGDPKEEFDQAMKQMNALLQGLWFAQKCKVQSNWHYTGRNVRLGESDKRICWWKSEDSDTFRVIYGDLSLADFNEAPERRAEE